MAAGQLAVIGGEDHQRVVGRTAGVERVEHPGERPVDLRAQPPVALDQEAPRQLRAQGDAVLGVVQHAKVLQQRLARLVRAGRMVPVVRQRHLIERMQVVERARQRVVRLVEAEGQGEGPARMAGDEVARLCSDVGRTAQVLGDGRPIHLAEAYAVDRREPVRAQQVIRRGVVEVELVHAAGARGRPGGIAVVAAAAEEPAGPAIVQQIGQARDVIVHRMPVQRDLAVVVGVGAGEQGGARRTAHRLGAVGTVKDGAALGQRVHARHLDAVVAVGGQGGARLLVGDDQQQVGRSG